MKIGVVCIILAALCGSLFGWYAATVRYVYTDSQFGPFSTTNKRVASQLDAYFASIEQNGIAKIQFVEGKTHDFGVMLRGSEGTHTFKLKNVGDGPLELQVVRSTCKCTVGELADTYIGPGQSTVVTMRWRVKTNKARFSQSAFFETNDPELTEFSLDVSGKATDQIAVIPRSWNVGDAASGETLRLSATIYSYHDRPIESTESRWITKGIAPFANVQIRPRPVSEENDDAHPVALQAFDVQATIRPGLPQGPLNHTYQFAFLVQAEDSTTQRQTIDMPLRGDLVGALSLLGGSRLKGRRGGRFRFDMGKVPVGTGRVDKLYVMLRGPLRNKVQLRIGKVTPSQVLEASLGDPVKQKKAVRYPLTLKIRKDAPEWERAGKHKDDFGIVLIEADVLDIPPLRLKVQFAVGNPLSDNR